LKKRLKKTVHVPVILGGGILSYMVAERLIEDGVTDYISMSRPFDRRGSARCPSSSNSFHRIHLTYPDTSFPLSGLTSM
jgi:phosphoribosylformimino-5-aminoimidazole carboxamide ribonucleotide (ProFAR) isomerase